MAGFDEDAVPAEFLCPLSLAIMEDPVFTVDGQCYDRFLIEEWLETHDTSPLTGKKLEHNGEVDKRLIPNYNMKNLIEKWQKSWTERLGVPTIDLSQLQLNTTRPPKLFSQTTFEVRGESPNFAQAADRHKKSALIGSGKDKNVYRGWWNGRDVAIMEFRTGTCETEAQILAKLGQHPHCCTFYGIADGARIIVNELAPLGNLADVLEDHRDALIRDSLLAKEMHLEAMQQICSGMLAITNSTLIHRDLALRNVVVMVYDLVTMRVKVKVTDFGLSRTGQYYSSEASEIAVRWTAPEALQAKKYSEQSDVWSFGVLIWELLDFAEHMPYWEVRDEKEVAMRVGTGSLQLFIPEYGDTDLWGVASKCLKRERKSRPTFEKLQVELRDLVIREAELRGIEAGTAMMMKQQGTVGQMGHRTGDILGTVSRLKNPLDALDHFVVPPAPPLDQFAIPPAPPLDQSAVPPAPHLDHFAVPPAPPLEHFAVPASQSPVVLPVTPVRQSSTEEEEVFDVKWAKFEDGLASQESSFSGIRRIDDGSDPGAATASTGFEPEYVPSEEYLSEDEFVGQLLPDDAFDVPPAPPQPPSNQNQRLSRDLETLLEKHKLSGAAPTLLSFGVEKPEDLFDLDEAAVTVMQDRHGLKGIDATRLRNYLQSNNPACMTVQAAQSQGDLAAVLKAMRDKPSDAAVQEEGCQAILVLNPAMRHLDPRYEEENAAQPDETLLLMEQHSAARVLIQASVTHTQRPNIQEVMCRLVAYLCHREGNQIEIAKAGGVGAVVQGMGTHLDNSAVQEWGCVALWGLALNPNNRVKVGNEGGVRVIIAGMMANPKSGAVQEQGCGALRVLATTDENQLRIVQAGGVRAIISAMGAFQANAGLQNKGCGALWNMVARGPQNRALVCSELGIAAVIWAMKNHLTNPSIQLRACATLRILAGTSEIQTRIVQDGGARAIVAAMQEHIKNTELQHGCLATLRNLGAIGANQVRVASEGGIMAVLMSMNAHESDHKVQGLACEALSNLTRHLRTEDQGTVLNHCLPPLLRAMRGHPKHPGVQQGACGSLSHLARNHAQNQERLRGEGVIELVIQAMLGHLEVPGVADASCAALRILAGNNPANQAAIQAADGIWVLLTTLEKHLVHASVAQQGIAALRNLSTSAAIQKKVVEERGIEIVLAAMKTHAGDPHLQDASCSFLYNMAFTPEYKIAIAKHGGVEAVIVAMRAHPGNAGVQVWGCSALRMVAVGNADNCRRIETCEGIEVILLSMQYHTPHSGLQEAAIRALNLLCQQYGCMLRISRGKGIATLLTGMNHHPQHAGVQEQGCACVTALAIQQENQVQIVAHMGIRAVLVAMKCHPGNPGVQIQGCSAIYNLGFHPPNKRVIAQEGGILGALNAMYHHRDNEGVQECAFGALSVVLNSVDAHNKTSVIPECAKIMKDNNARSYISAAVTRFPKNRKIQDWGKAMMKHV